MASRDGSPSFSANISTFHTPFCDATVGNTKNRGYAHHTSSNHEGEAHNTWSRRDKSKLGHVRRLKRAAPKNNSSQFHPLHPPLTNTTTTIDADTNHVVDHSHRQIDIQGQ